MPKISETKADQLAPFWQTSDGKTVRLCRDLGRACAGIDLSEEYLKDHAVPRINVAMLNAAAHEKPVGTPAVPTPSFATGGEDF